jgi:hypothetical protein
MPVLVVVSAGIIMMVYDFMRMLSLSNKSKSNSKR